jgi:RNA polymerase sigma-70 factor (ECF subfamily)
MLEDKVLVWSLKRFYAKYASDLLALAASLLGDRHAAEDVVQDVFVRFIESLGDFELTGTLRGYLATCVANRSRDVRRRTRYRASRSTEASRRSDVQQDGPLSVAIAGERRQRVAAALSRLPYEQREAVLLHLQGGLTLRSVAEAQGVSAKTAESRYRYAMNKLRSLLNGDMEP